jgi:hypothetical protein
MAYIHTYLIHIIQWNVIQPFKKKEIPSSLTTWMNVGTLN